MSNAPPPYVPPSMPMSYATALQPEVVAAGRRAGILMLVLGGLILLLGFCNILQAILKPAGELLSQQQRLFGQQNATELSAEAYKALTVIVGALTLATGVVMSVLGLLVRRGNRGATWAGLIITILLAGLLGLGSLFVLIAGLQSPPLLALVFLPAIPLVFFIWQTVLLLRAVRAAGSVAAMQQAYAMQYWQHQQAMQAYGGYGYGQPMQQPPPPVQATLAQPPTSPNDLFS